MKIKRQNIVIAILVFVFIAVYFKLNTHETQFYTLFYRIAYIHTPMELEEVSYVSQLSSSVEGTYTFNEEDELAVWEHFVTWLNDTPMIKIRTTNGFSYTGEGIFLKFKGIEEELWIVVAHDGKSFKIGNYKWKPLGDIVLPVDEEYLLEIKAEQQANE